MSLYGLVYLCGLAAYPLAAWLAGARDPALCRLNCTLCAALGAMLGGRLGYALFYDSAYVINHPQEILYIWHGGMSFHGGLLGTVLALWLILKKLPPLLRELDYICLAALVIIPLGRTVNFLNGELWGTVTDLPWGVVFEAAGPQPRHPVQLYEAAAEGPLLGMLLWVSLRLWHQRIRAQSGDLCLAYAVLYALLRFGTEFFREPDAQLGYVLAGTLSMGQCLCLLLICVCLPLLVYRLRRS